MAEQTLLPNDTTPVSLAEEATETKCVIKSGQSIQIGEDSTLKMLDGTLKKDLENCELESGSSLVFVYTEPEEKKMQFINEKPKSRVHEQVHIPVPLPDPTSAPTSVNAYVAETIVTKANKPENKVGADPITGMVLAAAAVAAIAVAAVTSTFASAASSAGKIKKKIKSKVDKAENNSPEQQEKKEEQKKCNSRSENVLSLIKEVELITKNSHINDMKAVQDKEFKKKLSELNAEIKTINRKLKEIEENKSKKRQQNK